MRAACELAPEVDAIRLIAHRDGMQPAVTVAHFLDSALARGEHGALVHGWLAMLRDAVGSERQDVAACDTASPPPVRCGWPAERMDALMAALVAAALAQVGDRTAWLAAILADRYRHAGSRHRRGGARAGRRERDRRRRRRAARADC